MHDVRVNREFKQIATVGSDTAAEVNFPQNETLRMYLCRSVKSGYVSRDVLP